MGGSTLSCTRNLLWFFQPCRRTQGICPLKDAQVLIQKVLQHYPRETKTQYKKTESYPFFIQLHASAKANYPSGERHLWSSPDFTTQALLHRNLKIGAANQISVVSRYFKKSTSSGHTYIHKVGFLLFVPPKCSRKQHCEALKPSNVRQIDRPLTYEFL